MRMSAIVFSQLACDCLSTLCIKCRASASLMLVDACEVMYVCVHRDGRLPKFMRCLYSV